MRLFAALELPDDVRDELAAAARSVALCDTAWADEKWVVAENLHVTLAFFGEVAQDDLGRIMDGVGEICSAAPIPRLVNARLVASPSPRRARMVWAEFDDPTGACESIARSLQAAFPEYVESASRPFRPHVTLCRARRPRPLDAGALSCGDSQFRHASGSMSVSAASVISSRLTPRGPVYATIGVRHFGGM